MSAPRNRRGAFWYKTGTSFESEVRNHVQDESGRDDGVAAVLAGYQPAQGAGNASYASAAPVDGAVVAAASVFGRQRVFFAGRDADVFGREHGIDRDCWPF